MAVFPSSYWYDKTKTLNPELIYKPTIRTESTMAHGPEFLTSPTLLGRLRQNPNDQTAWKDFLHRYGLLVKRWCQHWGLQPADAEDVTQNVLVELSQQMSKFAYDPNGRFRSWLKTIAYRAWCDFLSHRGKRQDQASGDSKVLELLHSQEACDDFLNQLEEEWKRELLEEAMRLVQQRVQSHTWEAFRLLAKENLSGQEVADQLGMKVGAVWVARSKVQKMIQEEVRNQEQLEEPPSED